MFIEFVNENLWWFVALAIVFNLLLLSVLQNSVRGANSVSALEMPALQRKGKSVVVDVNKAEHYAASHIPKSVNFPLETLNAENKALLKHKESTVIVTCQTGSRSAKAAKQLISLGFTNVNILNGGLVAWSKENLPLTKVKA
jgi:rhodanese-related sulfurtransferase